MAEEKKTTTKSTTATPSKSTTKTTKTAEATTKKAPAKTTNKQSEAKPAAKTTKASTSKKVEVAKVEEVKEVVAPKKEVKVVEKPKKLAEKQLKVTLVKSTIGYNKKQALVVKALGLGKLNSSHILPDNACVRGMIFKVSHLVKVEELN